MDIRVIFADRLSAEFGIRVDHSELIADGKFRRITPEDDRRRWAEKRAKREAEIAAQAKGE